MSKVKRKELVEKANDHELRLFRIEKALEQHGINWFVEEPKLKQLDQSVFDGEPEQIKWAVVTNEGAVLKFELEPVVKDGLWHWTHGNGCRQHALIGQYDASNWKNSLIERDKVELTGSDLARAMLERGDKWVLCLAANHPSNIDYDQIPDVVTEYISKGFRAGHYHWMYVVPINNQGEPLTAAEAGL